MLGAVLILVHVLTEGRAAQAFSYLAVGVLAVVTIAASSRTGSSRVTLAWRIIGLSVGMWVVGDAAWYVLDARGEIPYPSPTDVFYVLGYPLLALGPLLLISAGRSRAAITRDLLDPALITISAVLLLWPFVFEPTVESGFSLATVTTLTYAASDLVFVAMFSILWFNPARRTLSTTLLSSAALLIFAGDLMTYFPALADAAAVVTDPIWLLGYLLAALAAIHQRRPSTRRVRTVSPMRKLVFVGTTLLALPSALLLDAFAADGFGPDNWLVLTGGITLALALVVLRGATMLNDVVAERRRADEARAQLGLVVNSAGVGIAFQCGDVMTATNATLQQMVGYTEQELRSMPYLDLIGSEELPAAMENRRAGVTGPSSFERRLRRRDGSSFRAQITLTPTPDGGVVAVVEDITDRIMLQRRVAESARLEAVGRLAGGIAHDFNNLLTAVRGNAELIKLGGSPEEVEESVDSIVDASERAAGLIRQLLTFSRQNEFTAEVVATPQYVRDATQLLSRVLGRTLAVEVQIHDDSPAILADRSQLDQVLLNLAVNARDAMPDGGTLCFSVDRFAHQGRDARYAEVEPGTYARLTVSDTGTGIPEETLSRIFEPFFTTKTDGKGTGLGLATTHGIVKRIGGHIRVSSTPGQGTTFEILFPEAAAPLGVPQVAA